MEIKGTARLFIYLSNTAINSYFITHEKLYYYDVNILLESASKCINVCILIRCTVHSIVIVRYQELAMNDPVEAISYLRVSDDITRSLTNPVVI